MMFQPQFPSICVKSGVPGLLNAFQKIAIHKRTSCKPQAVEFFPIP